MKNRDNKSHPFEPTTSELPPVTTKPSKLDRRSFFKFTGGGLAVAFVLYDAFSIAGEAPIAVENVPPTSQVAAWIHIDTEGNVNVFTGKVEVGQNIRTSLAQVVAEELSVPLASVNMVMGDTDRVPYDAGTFGSRSTPQMGTQLRKAAATARKALIEMAAKEWNMPVDTLIAGDGMVSAKTGSKKVGYGALTNGQQLLLTISDSVEMTAPEKWTIAGKTVLKVNGRSFITGKHPYVSDLTMPGMMYGKVLRAPAYGAKLVSADLSRAKAMTGVVVHQDGDFIGVAANDFNTAGKALLAIEAKWELVSGQPGTDTIFDYLLKNVSGQSDGRNGGNEQGSLQQGMDAAVVKHSSTHHIHYIAHVPLEPRAALASWEQGKLTVSTGTQRPFGVQDELAREFKISKEKVRVLMPDTGSGYGGKHSGEAAIEAARLAKAANKPVKLVWTREEEFTWAYFRPGGVITIESGVQADGTLTAWKFTNYNSGGAGLATPYQVSNQRVSHVRAASPLKQGSYRGLASTANVFAREAHMSDLARMLKMDQLEFRLKNLRDDRLIAVLAKVSSEFGWKRSKKPGVGFGIAAGFEKGGYVATCAEVEVNADKEVKVVRIAQAFECGAIINPHHLEQQVMGSIVQGLGGALFEAVDFGEGKILNPRLSAYRVPRFSDVPPIDIYLINRQDLSSAGAGEAAIIGVAPAIRNALLDLGGTAPDDLPMIPNGVWDNSKSVKKDS